jgi:parvulin-like peptidyl-prolyl isomerase
MKFRVILSAALIGGVLSARATTQSPAALTNSNPETAMTALFGDPVIVKAKGFQIKRSEFDQVVSGAKANAAAAGQQLPPDFSISILDQLISIQTLLQTANDADKATGQTDADIQYTNLVKRFVSQDAFERQLKAVGMTIADLRAKATQEAVAKAALKRQLGISVTDDESRDYYTKHPADFEQPEMVHARHILLMTIDPSTRGPLGTNSIAAKRKQIDDLRQQILKGADFSTLAEQYSEDPGSKSRGGELPMFSRGQMVPEFEAAAFSLGTNEVSEVVTTQYGYHLIKVLEHVPAKKVEFTTVDQDIKDALGRVKIAKVAPAFVKKLRADQQVEITDPDLKTMEEQAQAQAQAQASEAAAGGGASDAPSSTNK